MKFRVFGGKLEISNRCGNPPTTFLRNDQLCFGVTQTDTIFANAQNYSYKPHRLEISGRMNLQDFHFQMCFSPQRRTTFRRVKSKKCFGPDVFCAFSLQNVLFATAAYNYSTSELQKVLRDRQFFSIFTSKSAFRHSGVQFLMSPLSTYLRTRRFNRPTFGLTRHTNL